MAEDSQFVPTVIDFQRFGLLNQDVEPESLKEIGCQMKEALCKTGFCYLKNHGISEDCIGSFMKVLKAFFGRPREEKLKIEKKKGDSELFGWQEVGSEALDADKPEDLKESFMFVPKHDYQEEWPVEGLQSVCHDMFVKCMELCFRICDILSIGLGWEKNFLRNAHSRIGKGDTMSGLRSHYYPPVQHGTERKPGQAWAGEHTDFGTFTILFQDNHGGLEVKIPGKGYTQAAPIPGTVIVLLGDLMQRWTADKLIAAKHRVRITEDGEQKGKHRMSFAMFAHPNYDYLVTCLDGSNKYKPITAFDFAMGKFRACNLRYKTE